METLAEIPGIARTTEIDEWQNDFYIPYINETAVVAEILTTLITQPTPRYLEIRVMF